MDKIKTTIGYNSLIIPPKDNEEYESIKQTTISLREARVSKLPILLDVLLQINDTIYSPERHCISLPALMFDSLDSRSWHERITNDKSDSKASSFYPFTCSCGEPGCAGIWNGIRVKNRRKTVEWRTSKEDGYKFLDKQFYSFDKAQYIQETSGLFRRIEQIEGLLSVPVYVRLSGSGNMSTLQDEYGFHKRGMARLNNPDYRAWWKARMRYQATRYG